MRPLQPVLLICFAAALNAQPSPGFSAQFNAIVEQASPRELYTLLYAMPKGGDLHNHADFAVFAETVYEAATDPAVLRGNQYFTRVRITACDGDRQPPLLFETVQRATWRRLPDCVREDFAPLAGLSANLKRLWLSSLKLDRPGEGRNEFFEGIVPRISELGRNPYLKVELLVRNMKFFGAEHVRYLETQAAPLNLIDQEGKPLDPEEGVRIWRERLDQPDAKATRVDVRFQITALRFAPNAEQMVEQAYAFVAKHRDLWVGINMAGREDNTKGAAPRFLDTFRRMRRIYSDIPLSIHAGEQDTPGPQVRDTLLLGAARIGHGVNLIGDPDTMLLMRGGRYLVEINLVSNRVLEYTPDITKHPFPEYLRTGIPVCLNTDDRGAWDSNMTDEYFTAVKNFHLTWPEIVELGRNSITYSFAEPELKKKMLAGYERDLAEFEATYSAPDWKARLSAIQPQISGYATRTLL